MRRRRREEEEEDFSQGESARGEAMGWRNFIHNVGIASSASMGEKQEDFRSGFSKSEVELYR